MFRINANIINTFVRKERDFQQDLKYLIQILIKILKLRDNFINFQFFCEDVEHVDKYEEEH